MFSKSIPFPRQLWILALFLLAPPCLAFDPNPDQDAYGLGMGGAVAAVAGGTHAVYWNPAGIARSSVPMAQLGLGFSHSGDLQFNTGVLYPFPDGTVFAFSQASDFPSAPGSSTVYIGSVALPLNSSKDFLFGLNLKYLALSTSLGPGLQEGRGLGLDFGFVYDLRRPKGTLASFSVAVKDAASQVRFTNNEEKSLARTFVFGAAYQGVPEARFEADMSIVDQTAGSSQDEDRVRLGAERFFAERFYSARVGIDGLFNHDARIALGAGYHPDKPFEICYSFEAGLNEPLFIHNLSFIWRFDRPGTVKVPGPKEASTSSPEINISSTSPAVPLGRPVSPIPLRKITVRADPSFFSPLGKQKVTVLSFPGESPQDIARWQVEFQDPDAQTVHKIAGPGPLPATLVWDGRSDDGKAARDGKYAIVLRTFDKGERLLSDDSGTVEILSARPLFALRSASPYLTSKVGSRGRTTALLSVIPGGPREVEQWDFVVREAATGRAVFEQKGSTRLPRSLAWNGKVGTSEPAKEGNYLCLLTAKDQAGNPLRCDAKLLVDNSPPELAVKGTDPLVDFINGPALRLGMTSQDRSGIQNWRVIVYGEAGTPVKIFQGLGQPPAEVRWDGKGLDGKPVEPGSLLRVLFSALDRTGNRGDAKAFPLQVDFKPLATSEQMTLSLATVRFAAGASDLDENGKTELQKAASSIKPYLAKSVLVVKGYAAPGESEDLVTLSHDRAAEVRKFLMKSLAVPAGSIYAVGYSAQKLPASASTSSSPDSQRRAVVTLTTKP